MTFQEAVQSVLSQYANFSGRARRSEYWWWYLATIVAYVVALILDAIVSQLIGFPIFVIIWFLGAIVPSLAVAARRLHDTNRTGWWQLIGIIPVIGAIVLIVFYVQDSDADNQYGASPKNGTVPGI